MNSIKIVMTGALAGAAAYFGQLLIPLIVLVTVLIMDYITGMGKAYVLGELSSKKGFEGILKKLGYLLLVAVGCVADWLIHSGLGQLGISFDFGGIVSGLISVWLIINELLSIVENLKALGVPEIAFLSKLMSRLKDSVDKEE